MFGKNHDALDYEGLVQSVDFFLREKPLDDFNEGNGITLLTFQRDHCGATGLKLFLVYVHLNLLLNEKVYFSHCSLNNQ